MFHFLRFLGVIFSALPTEDSSTIVFWTDDLSLRFPSTESSFF